MRQLRSAHRGQSIIQDAQSINVVLDYHNILTTTTRPPTAAKALVWSPRAGPPTQTLVLPRPPTSRPEGISRPFPPSTSTTHSTRDAVPTTRRTACRTDGVQNARPPSPTRRDHPTHESRTTRVSTSRGQAPLGLSHPPVSTSPSLHQSHSTPPTPP